MSQSQFFIPGPVGKLEALYEPCTENPRAITAIICHPHSLQGGTMTNKVVHMVARALLKVGAHCVRFNFRSVGESAGRFDNGRGEQDDLRAVIEWVKQQHPQDEIWLAGFSFGSYVSAAVAAHLPEVKQLISIAPPVNHYDFSSLPTFQGSWIVIQPLADEIVPADQVIAWAKTLPNKVVFKEFPETSHFFHGKLIELREFLISQLLN